MAERCEHLVDFDRCEIVTLRRHKSIIRVGCKKCGTAVTLDDVLRALTERDNVLNKRLIEVEVRLGIGKSTTETPPEPEGGEHVASADSEPD